MAEFKWFEETKPKLNIHEANGVVYLSNPGLDALGFVSSGTSTRLGGVSGSCYASMNLAFRDGDPEENTRENYRRFFAAAHLEEKNIAYANQVHGTRVEVVPSGFKTSAVDFKGSDFKETDGLVTNAEGIAIVMYSSDCNVIFFADPAKRAIGICHSGWRGSADKIAREVVLKMQEEYGTNPVDITAAFAPSICPECYEVSEDVASRFRDDFPKDILRKKTNGKYLLDLWGANTATLLACGLAPEKIHQANCCTLCNSGLLFSHRAQGELRGNNMSYIKIKKK